MKKLNKGCFITFEGADGCGKTTQIKLLKEYLDKKNIESITTLEPGGCELGKNLRQILLHYDKPVADKCEIFLYLADRAQHVETTIKPALLDNKVVLCDRYVDSTLAYQGYGRGYDIDLMLNLNEIATSNLKPDLTILLDVSTEVAQTRVGSEKDRMEGEGLIFHKKVREGYLELAKKEPERIKIVDASQTIEEVFCEIKKIIEEFLNQ